MTDRILEINVMHLNLLKVEMITRKPNKKIYEKNKVILIKLSSSDFVFILPLLTLFLFCLLVGLLTFMTRK